MHRPATVSMFAARFALIHKKFQAFRVNASISDGRWYQTLLTAIHKFQLKDVEVNLYTFLFVTNDSIVFTSEVIPKNKTLKLLASLQKYLFNTNMANSLLFFLKSIFPWKNGAGGLRFLDFS